MSLFKNWKLKRKEVKLVEDNKKLKELVKETELIMNMTDDIDIKDAVNLVKDELEYNKLSNSAEAKKLETRVIHMLQDLKLLVNNKKKDKAITLAKEIVRTLKERNIVA